MIEQKHKTRVGQLKRLLDAIPDDAIVTVEATREADIRSELLKVKTTLEDFFDHHGLNIGAIERHKLSQAYQAIRDVMESV